MTFVSSVRITHVSDVEPKPGDRRRKRTRQLDVFLDDCRLDLVVRVRRDADHPRVAGRPSEFPDVRAQVCPWVSSIVSAIG